MGPRLVSFRPRTYTHTPAWEGTDLITLTHSSDMIAFLSPNVIPFDQPDLCSLLFLEGLCV